MFKTELVEIDGDTDLTQYVGRHAVFTTYEGEERVGEVTAFDGFHPVITFDDGKWARGTAETNEEGTSTLALLDEQSYVLDTVLRRIRNYTPYALTGDAGCMTPDTLESHGAIFLMRVRDALCEAVEYQAEQSDTFDSDGIHEISDGAVPIYTYERWQTFVDLGAWQEDASELDGYTESADLTERAGVALYIIAERLCSALFEEITSALDGAE